MSKVDKKLKRWLQNTPTDAPKDSVLAIIERFFPDQWKEEGSSHVLIQDDRLIGIPDYGPAGDFTVVIKGGQRVMAPYLKRLAQTIVLLREEE